MSVCTLKFLVLMLQLAYLKKVKMLHESTKIFSSMQRRLKQLYDKHSFVFVQLSLISMLLLWDVLKIQIKRSKYFLRIAVTKILYCIFISNEVAYAYTATILSHIVLHVACMPQSVLHYYFVLWSKEEGEGAQSAESCNM